MLCPNCTAVPAKTNIGYFGSHATFCQLSLVECASCGLVYANPMPSQSDLAIYYKSYWKGEVATVSASTRFYYLAQSISRLYYIGQFHKFAPNQKILDIGAGPGLFLDALKHQKILVNYSAVEPDIIQRGALSRKNMVGEVYGDVSEIPTTTKFDLIVLSHVLEHVPAPHTFIAQLFNLLGSTGHLFIEVPNRDHLYKKMHEPHLLFFNDSSLRSTLGAHGTPIDVSTVGHLTDGLSFDHPNKAPLKLVRLVKEYIKTLISLLTPKAIEKKIRKYEMAKYGGNRQWLRAIVAPSPIDTDIETSAADPL